jgi:uncharacterized damage-inducible protein DinB
LSKDHFQQLAGYNQWANARLYAAAFALPDEEFKKPVGVFFKSLHGTLNHLLLTDRLWLKRLTGIGGHPHRLDAILYEQRVDLAKARLAEDARLIEVIGAYSDEDLKGSVQYHTTSGAQQEQRLSDILLHLFNHQAHHRGQGHACCSILTGQEPPALDLLLYQRKAPAPDVAALIARTTPA